MKIVYDDIIYSLQKVGGGSVYWTEVTKRCDEISVYYAYSNMEVIFLCEKIKWFKTMKK